jgi:cell division protein DivIC
MRSTSQTEKRITASQRRSRVWLFGVCCFLAWAGLNLWTQGERHSAKAQQLAEAEAKLEQITKQNEAYNLEVTRLSDREYIEQKIRKDYHYTRDGETMFYTPKSNP